MNKKEEGWYVPNSSILNDIVPRWRRTGGGVVESMLSKNKEEALDLAISYCRARIVATNSHIKFLEDNK